MLLTSANMTTAAYDKNQTVTSGVGDSPQCQVLAATVKVAGELRSRRRGRVVVVRDLLAPSDRLGSHQIGAEYAGPVRSEPVMERATARGSVFNTAERIGERRSVGEVLVDDGERSIVDRAEPSHSLLVHRQPVEVERLTDAGMVANPSGHLLSAHSGRLGGNAMGGAGREVLDGDLLRRREVQQGGGCGVVRHSAQLRTGW